MDQTLDFFVAPENLGFLVAGCAVLAILLLELLGTLIGISIHMFGASVHVDVDCDADGFMGWLNPGKMPVIILFIAFLGCLSIAGFSFNWIWTGFHFKMLSALFTTPIVSVAVLPIVSAFSNSLGPILQSDDNNAITLDALVGYYGTVTMGPIRDHAAGQAKFKDDFGVTHYMDVVAEPGHTLEMGDDVVLLQRLAEDSFMFVVRKAG